ncbi:MAG: hypothetical protein AAFX99_12155, partial [Myxococcota bacterium]
MNRPTVDRSIQHQTAHGLHLRSMLLLLLFASLLAIGMVACGGDETTTPSGSNGTPNNTTARTTDGTSTTGGETATAGLNCSTGPEVTYDNFGAGFMTARCQACHGTQSSNRYGAPPAVYFDTLEDVATWKERILER